MEDMGEVPFGDIERDLQNKEQENQYLRSRNFGLQEMAESGSFPRNDANVIEFKLSSDELLEKIEHYLRGDILKTRKNNDGQVESYYSPPTKKISVTLFKDEKGNIYIVDELGGEEWDVLSVIEGTEQGPIETEIEDNYKEAILDMIKRGLKSKKNTIEKVGYATKEIIDTSRTNLSDYGVQELMNTLSMYITKETFLSFYKEERINEIMLDIGHELNKFLLINGKQMGLDTEYKKTKYPLIVVTILHAIENAYRRAISGNENRGTREGIVVTQHQNTGNSQNSYIPVPKKRWNPFDKSTW